MNVTHSRYQVYVHSSRVAVPQLTDPVYCNINESVEYSHQPGGHSRAQSQHEVGAQHAAELCPAQHLDSEHDSCGKRTVGLSFGRVCVR